MEMRRKYALDLQLRIPRSDAAMQRRL